MIYAGNPTQIVRVLAFLTFLAALLAVWVSSPTAVKGLWSAKGLVLEAPSAFVFLLTIRPIFRLAHKVTFASAWLYPMLDGDWEGEVHSNWPRIRAMMEAAKGAEHRFNALSDPTPVAFDASPVKFTAKIESGFFAFQIRLVMSETRSSRTVFVKPEWRKPERPRLYYVYGQEEDGEVEVTDRRKHMGAAYLEYDQTSGVLSGDYWTERQGELGLNTAGRIRLVRKRSHTNAVVGR